MLLILGKKCDNAVKMLAKLLLFWYNYMVTTIETKVVHAQRLYERADYGANSAKKRRLEVVC